jgi:predicted phosphoadenosine phosphosulfate sulfurtransferase
MGTKITKFIRFFNPKWEQNVGLIPNPNHEKKKKKQKQKHDMCKTIIQQDFIARLK